MDPREIDDALWPERHSKERLIKIREKSPKTFSALYQQRPSPEDGTIISISDFQYYNPTENIRFQELIQTWDCSFKGNIKSDWVVGEIWGRVGAKYYLVAERRGKWGIQKTMDNILGMTSDYPKAKVKMVEDKANGPAIIEILKQYITGLIPCTPDGDKVSRANAVAHCVESHNVYLPDPAIYPWVKGFVEEWRSFPNGSHDDRVDASTQAWHRFETKKRVTNIQIGVITKKANFRSNPT